MRYKIMLILERGFSLLLLAACAGAPRARLTEWRNDELTVCCPTSQHHCSEKDWQRAAAPYCTGVTKLIGGQIREGLAGYQASTVDKGKRFQLQPQTEVQSCRTYRCEGDVIPPAE